MISWIREKSLKTLIFICIFITLLSCIILFSQTSQSATKSQSSKPSEYSYSTLQDVPILSSAFTAELNDVSVLSSAITPEEVKLREQQVQIAKKIERSIILRAQQPGSIVTLKDTLQATYQRINSEIQLLQAQQLLQLKKNGDICGIKKSSSIHEDSYTSLTL